MKKVLIITRHYLDENNGGSNCSKANIRAIGELFNDVTLIYPEHDDHMSLLSLPSNIKAIPCYDYRKKWKKGVDIYMGKLHRAPSFILNHLKEEYYDIIFLDHSIVSNGIIKRISKTGSKIVTIHHNVESEYVRDNLPSLLYRLPYVHYVRKTERTALNMSSVNITLSEHDAQTFRNWYPYKDIHCYNMGTFLYDDIPKLICERVTKRCKIFAITGSLNFQQSQKPILLFLKYYYPLLLTRIPDAKLIISGRNPSPKIIDACRHFPSIDLIANPVVISDVIMNADVYICPLNSGSGVKLRIMDGLKLGLPILGHSVSLNGYEAIKKDGYYLEYNNDESFLKAIDTLNEMTYNKQKVYDSFYSYFSFDAGKGRLESILKQEKLI